MTDFAEIWSYLARGPLLWLTATLAAYAAGDACFRAAGRKPWANPVSADTYLFQVTALPAGPDPVPAPLGFGTLRIYQPDWR